MKNDTPKISVIMGDASFREGFHLVDYLMRQTLPKDSYELIWVEYYSKVKEELDEKEGVKIIKLNKTDKPYHMSSCFNEGIKISSGEIIVIPDADLVVPHNFLEVIAEEHTKCENLVMYIKRWDEPEDKHTGDVSLRHLESVCKLLNPTNYGGCLTVRKNWLLEVDGYDESPVFAGFSANAMDLYTRLKNLGLHIMWHPYLKVYHPWHPKTSHPSIEYNLQWEIIKDRSLKGLIYPYKGLSGDIHKESSPEDLVEIFNRKKVFYRLQYIASKFFRKLAGI